MNHEKSSITPPQELARSSSEKRYSTLATDLVNDLHTREDLNSSSKREFIAGAVIGVFRRVDELKQRSEKGEYTEDYLISSIKSFFENPNGTIRKRNGEEVSLLQRVTRTGGLRAILVHAQELGMIEPGALAVEEFLPYEDEDGNSRFDSEAFREGYYEATSRWGVGSEDDLIDASVASSEAATGRVEELPDLDVEQREPTDDYSGINQELPDLSTPEVRPSFQIETSVAMGGQAVGEVMDYGWNPSAGEPTESPEEARFRERERLTAERQRFINEVVHPAEVELRSIATFAGEEWRAASQVEVMMRELNGQVAALHRDLEYNSQQSGVTNAHRQRAELLREGLNSVRVATGDVESAVDARQLNDSSSEYMESTKSLATVVAPVRSELEDVVVYAQRGAGERGALLEGLSRLQNVLSEVVDNRSGYGYEADGARIRQAIDGVMESVSRYRVQTQGVHEALERAVKSVGRIPGDESFELPEGYYTDR